MLDHDRDLRPGFNQFSTPNDKINPNAGLLPIPGVWVALTRTNLGLGGAATRPLHPGGGSLQRTARRRTNYFACVWKCDFLCRNRQAVEVWDAVRSRGSNQAGNGMRVHLGGGLQAGLANAVAPAAGHAPC